VEEDVPYDQLMKVIKLLAKLNLPAHLKKLLAGKISHSA
jgi:hypothetical protein